MKTLLIALILLLHCAITYSQSGWVRKTPAFRMHHAMVYDEKRERVVMFGGYNWIGDPGLNDMWEWDGVSWHEIKVDVKPRTRWGHSMAYDSHLNRILLYGGVAADDYGNGIGLTDTWEWDGSIWNQISNSGPGNGFDVIIYDKARNELIIYTNDYENETGHTFRLNGKEWVLIEIESPGYQSDFDMVYDEVNQNHYCLETTA